MNRFISSRLCLLAAMLCSVAAALPATGQDLDLAQAPLFSGTNAQPNVLVAVDDSGSMDQEVLFKTDEGVLYWRRSTTSAADSNGKFYNSGNDIYTYVFPFDHIQDNPTIPPIPGMAYARAADYNKAYFNPSTTYAPWLKADGSRELRTDEPSTDARYSPKQNGRLNLTVAHLDAFDFQKDMTVSGFHWKHWRKLFKGCLYNENGVDECLDRLGPSELKSTITNHNFSKDQIAYCVQNDENLLDCLKQIDLGVDEKADKDKSYRLLYFPATFYLKVASDRQADDAGLPSDYGYDEDKTIEGKGPDGKALVGYEIKPENFTNTDGTQNIAAYNEAIQNFANWFTYHRKRNLATRGGIVAAFDRIDDIRVGSCTINNRSTLNMKKLNDINQRVQFYSDIFNIDYSVNRGTPNRKALDHLGKQLQGNKSIISAPCQRNFAILFTDGYSNADTVNAGGNVDGNHGNPFKDSYSNTIADIAMKYYKNLNTHVEGILRPPESCDEPNPPKRLDCETDLHMTTFGVTLNQTGTIYNNYDEYQIENNDPYANAPPWPNVNTGGKSAKQIDDLWHATINSRGELLNANTPAEIADRFTTALERILGEEGSSTSLSLNSSSLATDSTAYQASFTAGAWSGELKALPQTDDNSIFGDPEWEASDKLTDKDITNPDKRVILTRVRTNCGKGNDKRATALFRFDQFKSSCAPLTEPELNFIRGRREGERAYGGIFRNRNNNILGDIVHSSPLYVGKPDRARYPTDWDDRLTENVNEQTDEDDAGAYSTPGGQGFAQGPAATRTKMVYVGANDGMLHGFDAQTGEEKLAFVPGSLLSSLSELTKPNYRHRYYVDGSPNAGDVVINKQWQTVLVGGLGAGGRSIYALNITEPNDFSDANADEIVMWEYNNDELGYNFGQPAIVRLHNGRWAAVFGNGYNSDSGSAQLFLVDIADGTLIKKIDTRSGPANGLSEVFPVDLDGDFISDYVYAGDLKGNLWKFDLTSESKTDWEVGMSGQPLFTATEDDGTTPQPITTQPQVAVHPYGRNYGVMVYFGTGKYLETNDRAAKTEVQNSVYGIWDLDVFTFNKADNGSPLFNTELTSNIPRSRLQAQQIVDTQVKNGDSYRLISDKSVDYQTSDDSEDGDGKRGWLIDLPVGNGEMVTTNGRVEDDTIAFSTTIPNIETCAASGSGYLLLLDRETGGRTDFPAFDLNGDKKLNIADTFPHDDKQISASGRLISDGIPGTPSRVTGESVAAYLVPISDGTTRMIYTSKKPDQRISWREIRR